MIICHFDDTNSSGGLDKQARLLAKTLRTAGMDVVVLASTRKWSRVGWTFDGDLPIRLFWTYASPQISGRYLPAALIWAAQLLVWLAINRKRVEIVHGHQIRIHAFVAALCRRWFGIPILFKSATGGAGADIRAIASRKYLGETGKRFLARNIDVFVASTSSIKADLLEGGVEARKIEVIPNGLQKPALVGRNADDLLRARRCLFLGRLAPDKNAPALARAAIAVADELDLTIDFYGRGRELPLLQQALSQSTSQRVRYAGYVEDTNAILRQYGWLILPSNAEGLSNAMLEGMLNGVVPIATRVSGCIDHIREGETGYFLNGVDDQSLRDGLKLAAGTSARDWRHMSDRVEALANAQFSMERVSGAYQALYAELLAGSPASFRSRATT